MVRRRHRDEREHPHSAQYTQKRRFAQLVGQPLEYRLRFLQQSMIGHPSGERVDLPTQAVLPGTSITLHQPMALQRPQCSGYLALVAPHDGCQSYHPDTAVRPGLVRRQSLEQRHISAQPGRRGCQIRSTS